MFAVAHSLTPALRHNPNFNPLTVSDNIAVFFEFGEQSDTFQKS